MFKVDIHVRNGTPDVSKPISHDKLLHYRFLIGITVNNYNQPRSLKGGVYRVSQMFFLTLVFTFWGSPVLGHVQIVSRINVYGSYDNCQYAQ